MKAAVLDDFAKGEYTLTIEEIPVPQPGEDEVLVQVQSVMLDLRDRLFLLHQAPWLVPDGTPMIGGGDFAGIVEKTGEKVTTLCKGNRVFGRVPLNRAGALAQYVCVPAKYCDVIPEGLDFDQAADAVLGIDLLRAFDLLDIQNGQKLILADGSERLLSRIRSLSDALELDLNILDSTDSEADSRNGRKNVMADAAFDPAGSTALGELSRRLIRQGKIVSFQSVPYHELIHHSGGSVLKYLPQALSLALRLGWNRQTLIFTPPEADAARLEKLGSLYRSGRLGVLPAPAVIPLDQAAHTVYELSENRGWQRILVHPADDKKA